MKKIILICTACIIGLPSFADYTITTNQPIYPIETYNQGYYTNPYQTQCQGQYINPYRYRNPYGYGNTLYSPYSALNSALPILGNTETSTPIVRNLGKSLLYSLLRRY